MRTVSASTTRELRIVCPAVDGYWEVDERSGDFDLRDELIGQVRRAVEASQISPGEHAIVTIAVTVQKETASK